MKRDVVHAIGMSSQCPCHLERASVQQEDLAFRSTQRQRERSRVPWSKS